MKLAARYESPRSASGPQDAVREDKSDARYRLIATRMRASASRLLHRVAPKNSPWRRAGLVAVLCGALIVVSSSAVLHEAILQVLVVVESSISRHSFLGATLFVVLAAVTATLTFVSIAVVVPAAVLAWGEIQSIALLWVGWVLGGLAAYGIGRLLGRPIARFIFSRGALEGIEGRLQRDSHFWFVLLIQLALPSEVIGYALGMVRYPLLRYLTALSIAELPYTIATVRLGASFLSGRTGLMVAAGLSIAVISLAAFYSLRYGAWAKSRGQGASSPASVRGSPN